MSEDDRDKLDWPPYQFVPRLAEQAKPLSTSTEPVKSGPDSSHIEHEDPTFHVLIRSLPFGFWITLVERFQMSGEWIVDGVEAKVFAYPLVLFGLTDLIRGNWKRIWLWLGAASCMHVLVGGWAVVMSLIAWQIQPRKQRPRFITLLPWLVAGGLFSLPGLIPAMQLSAGV